MVQIDPTDAIKALDAAIKLSEMSVAAKARAMRRTGGTATSEREHANSARYSERADERFQIVRAFIEGALK